MDRSDVVAVLATYTADLQPFESSTIEELRELRAAIAANADSVFAPEAPTRPQISLDPALQTELESLAGSGAVAFAPPARIFRKTISSRTEFNLLGTPAWARAALPSKTFGPFLGPDAAIYWFDLYARADTVSLVRDVDGAPLILVPANVTRVRNRFTFGPGAAAISTALLTGTGAAGEMCPLRVRGGSIRFSLTPAEASSGVFSVAKGAQVTALFQFESATTDGASVQLTRELRLTWTGSGPARAQVQGFRYTAADTSTQINAAAASFTYDALLGGARLQLRQAGDGTALDFGRAAKGALALEGQSAIQRASYLLLSADGSGGLTQPATSGYLELELAGDLRGRGSGLPSSGAQLRTPTVLANPLVTTARAPARSFIRKSEIRALAGRRIGPGIISRDRDSCRQRARVLVSGGRRIVADCSCDDRGSLQPSASAGRLLARYIPAAGLRRRLHRCRQAAHFRIDAGGVFRNTGGWAGDVARARERAAEGHPAWQVLGFRHARIVRGEGRLRGAVMAIDGDCPDPARSLRREHRRRAEVLSWPPRLWLCRMWDRVEQRRSGRVRLAAACRSATAPG